MTLSPGAIGGIAAACVLMTLFLIGLIYYVTKRRRENSEYKDRCNRLWQKYGRKKSEETKETATFPYADPTFLTTPVPGQTFTSRELKQEFVIPRKEDTKNQDAEKCPLMSMQSPIDPEGLNPDLYMNGTEKVSLSGSSSHSSGSRPPQVFFSIEYDDTFNILKVFIDQARHLRPQSYASISDPYCVVTLLPRQSTEKQSHVQRKTVDPIFQESFSFELEKNQLKDTIVQIKFFEYDQYSRDECIGTVLQKLNELDLSTKIDLWRRIPLASSGQLSEKAGDLLLRLGYLPSAEKLTVVLLKARSLKEVGSDEDKRAPDPYIRVAVYHNGTLLKKKKTSTKKKTCSPTYNQAINFSVPLHVLPQVELHFNVIHEPGLKLGRLEKKEIIGFLEIGPHSSGEEKDHWRDLMSNKPQARWHHLAITASEDSPQLDDLHN